jgi:hypothetical protein
MIIKGIKRWYSRLFLSSRAPALHRSRCRKESSLPLGEAAPTENEEECFCSSRLKSATALARKGGWGRGPGLGRSGGVAGHLRMFRVRFVSERPRRESWQPQPPIEQTGMVSASAALLKVKRPCVLQKKSAPPMSNQPKRPRHKKHGHGPQQFTFPGEWQSFLCLVKTKAQGERCRKWLWKVGTEKFYQW